MSDEYTASIDRDADGRAARLVFTRAQPEAQATVNGAETAFLSASPLYAVCLCGCGGTFPAGGRRRYYSDRCRLTAWATKQAKTARQRVIPGESRVERAFAAWIASEDGRVVEAEVIRRAMLLRGQGVKGYGIAALIEAIRYDHAIRILGAGDGFRINNSHRSLLARHVMEREPSLADFFETRDLRGRT